jgi:predicted Zn-dependent protease
LQLVAAQPHDAAELCLNKALQAEAQTLHHVHTLPGEVYSNTVRMVEETEELKSRLSSEEDESLHDQLARLYRQTGDTEDAAVALEQMKVPQWRWRESAVIVVWDIHSSTLDDGP